MHLLQLLLGQHQAVHLFLARGARDADAADERGSSLLLFLGLSNGRARQTVWGGGKRKSKKTEPGFTLMKEETGKVAKSDEAFAPVRCDTTCSATSP